MILGSKCTNSCTRLTNKDGFLEVKGHSNLTYCEVAV